jgi:DNA-directed RNA polymerase specialized sigma24 family protein
MSPSGSAMPSFPPSVVVLRPPREASDPELLVAMARDDRDAFRELARRHAERIARFCARQVGSVATGEDLAQDVLVTAWEARSRFAGGDALAWLFTLAVNRCRKHHRSFRRWLTARERLEQLPAPASSSLIEDAETRQLVRRAHRLMGTVLTEGNREALLLRLDADLDYRGTLSCDACRTRRRAVSAVQLATRAPLPIDVARVLARVDSQIDQRPGSQWRALVASAVTVLALLVAGLGVSQAVVAVVTRVPCSVLEVERLPVAQRLKPTFAGPDSVCGRRTSCSGQHHDEPGLAAVRSSVPEPPRTSRRLSPGRTATP